MSQNEDFSHEELTLIGQAISFYLEEELGDQRHRELLGKVQAAARRKLPGNDFEAEGLRIATRVLEGDDESVLDSVVHDECSATASGINNAGAESGEVPSVEGLVGSRDPEGCWSRSHAGSPGTWIVASPIPQSSNPSAFSK